MHLSAIDAPSDLYGEVTDVSRPLIYKLNQASMRAGTYDALHSLLVWALASMEGVVKRDLDAHIKVEGLPLHVLATPAEIRPPESLSDARTDTDAGESITNEPESVVEAPSPAAAEIVPLTGDMLPDSAEDVAAEAEIAAAVAEVGAPAPAPVEVAPAAKTTRVAKPK